ncbi:amino acid transporter [Rhizophagus irregularis]|uniref:Amino acid transporter n=4 Tax=Rhizophagus irregularis TaxID=588596 RepID=A0A2I1EG21_9GLOM|nr:amino acid/polyamine transporter I [Rhizophagus irregularis DAOM 181602=DAOM 197198]EXX65498.1 Mup1p [Rhizophagus irregularis DAOM 197198w]PKC11519.1 amino acid transporter [Rhizophagus irregularis]PKC61904.1 amino acid transporter [Rhizophagus irregularis]PKY21061.1 amino acid transporter [Rhizophagus irregularis]POG68185.1 amino acid/polyamine transporter I [Rhizophagus irregularis DAOM 181602=DAOM 197198]|eukprot:XP_025175051.1 amino acid/polyamine transporter I [Rhizophagus irregularis DAOM 181602=DAOM 197198]
MSRHLETSSTSSTISSNDNRNKLLGVIYGIGMNVNDIIGAGIFTTPGIVWKQVKSPYVVIILWIIGGIVSFCGSLVYTEFGITHQDSGGETIYLASSFPQPKMLASYLFSFMFIFIIRPGIICAVLQSAAQYAWYTFEGKSPSIDSSSNGWSNEFKPYWILKLISVMLLLLITGYHMLSNRWANRINQALAVIKMITIIIIALSGMSKYHDTGNWKLTLESPDSKFSVLTPYSVAIIEVFFSYNGWNNLNYSLDEFRNPEKKLRMSNSYSVGIVAILYLMVNIAFISAVPPQLVIGTSTEHFNETIAADFFFMIFNSVVVSRILSFFVVLSAIGTAATSIWSGSRVIVSAAKSNFFPIFSDELESRHNTFETPVNALFTQFIWCAFLMLIVSSSVVVDVFILFTSISMFSSWIFYIITGIGLLVFRKSQGYNSKLLLTIVNYLFIFSGFGIVGLAFFFIPRPKVSYFNNISFIFITFIALIVGMLLWFVLFYRPHLKEKSRRRWTSEISTQVKIQIAATLAESK